jgi:hypothetical protein
MTQTKIQGKFYSLQHQKSLEACLKLTPNHHPRRHFFGSQTELNKLAEVACLDFGTSVKGEEV